MNGFSTVPVRSYGASAGQNVATRYTPPPRPPWVFVCFLLLLLLFVPVHAERLDGAVEETKDGEEDEVDDQ